MKWLSEICFRLAGWTFVGRVPDDEPKLIAIGYPHTSNWDFFVYLAIAGHFGIKTRFLMHEGLFVGPLGWLLRRWGGIPVQGGAKAIVSTMVSTFKATDGLVLAIAPEGTRAGGSAWKSGFWRIADGADVPVIMGFVDGNAKQMGFGPCLRVNGDPEAWMGQARAFYADKQGLKRQNRGPIELAR
jgi:1-acyl-sn-glycerol-3-phosphate acyltransferase